MIQSHQVNTHQLSMQWKCRSCFCWCVFTVRHPALGASPCLNDSSKALQDWGFHLPGRSGKRHDLGRSCLSECRDCKTFCLVRSPIAKQSRERLSSLVLEYPLGCVETAFGSLCLSVVTPQWWSCAGQHCACCLTGLGTKLGSTQKEQECLRVPGQGNTKGTLLPALLCS